MKDETKQYNVVIHDDAAQMLYSHVRFLTNVSVPAAQKLRSTLFDAFASLKKMPHRCPSFETYRTQGTYRRLIVGQYQIIYSINENESIVNVCYILDSRRDNDI